MYFLMIILTVILPFIRKCFFFWPPCQVDSILLRLKFLNSLLLKKHGQVIFSFSDNSSFCKKTIKDVRHSSLLGITPISQNPLLYGFLIQMCQDNSLSFFFRFTYNRQKDCFFYSKKLEHKIQKIKKISETLTKTYQPIVIRQSQYLTQCAIWLKAISGASCPLDSYLVLFISLLRLIIDRS